MLLITLQYIPPGLDVAFLAIKQDALQHSYYPFVFYTHVYFSMFALLAGFTQFSETFRSKYARLHRTIGKVYIFIVLFISGPTGFIMGCLANGGWVAQIAFCLLAVFWMFFTYQALTAIKNGNVCAHKKWMYRSYALTLSAITLRLWKWGIVLVFQPRPMDVYRIVAWLGWVGNWIVVEWMIWFKNKKHSNIIINTVALNS